MALTDRIIALADALGDGALALRERLLNTRLARSALQMRGALAAGAPEAAHHRASGGALGRGSHRRHRRTHAIEDLATQTGFTRKHLGNLFQQQVGLSPKSLARIHRFRGALALLNSGDGQVPWAELAEQCGYYDQSHLINEFRRFTGFSPVGARRAATAPTRAAWCCRS